MQGLPLDGHGNMFFAGRHIHRKGRQFVRRNGAQMSRRDEIFQLGQFIANLIPDIAIGAGVDAHHPVDGLVVQAVELFPAQSPAVAHGL